MKLLNRWRTRRWTKKVAVPMGEGLMIGATASGESPGKGWKPIPGHPGGFYLVGTGEVPPQLPDDFGPTDGGPHEG